MNRNDSIVIRFLSVMAMAIALSSLALPIEAWPRHGSGGTSTVVVPQLVAASTGTSGLPAVDTTLHGSGATERPAWNWNEAQYNYSVGSNFYIGGWGGTWDSAQIASVKYCVNANCITVNAPSLNSRTNVYEWVFNPTSLTGLGGGGDNLYTIRAYITPVNGYQFYQDLQIYLYNNGTATRSIVYVSAQCSGCDNTGNGTSASPWQHILYALGNGHVSDGGIVALKDCQPTPIGNSFTQTTPGVYSEDQANAGTTWGSANTKTIDVECDPATPSNKYAWISRTNQIDTTAGASCTRSGDCMVLVGINKIRFDGVNGSVAFDASKILAVKTGSGDAYFATNFYYLNGAGVVDPNGTDGPTTHYTFCDGWFYQNYGIGSISESQINNCSEGSPRLNRNTTVQNSYDLTEMVNAWNSAGNGTAFLNVIGQHPVSQQRNLYTNCNWQTCATPINAVYDGVSKTTITLDPLTQIETHNSGATFLNGAFCDACYIDIKTGTGAGQEFQIFSTTNSTNTVIVLGDVHALVIGQEIDLNEHGHTDCGQFEGISTVTGVRISNITTQNYRCTETDHTLDLQPLLLQTFGFRSNSSAFPLSPTLTTTSGSNLGTLSQPTALYKFDTLALTTGNLENHRIEKDVLPLTPTSAQSSCALNVVTVKLTGNFPPVATGDVINMVSSDQPGAFSATAVSITMLPNSYNQFTYPVSACNGLTDAAGNITAQDASGGQTVYFSDNWNSSNSNVVFVYDRVIQQLFWAGYLEDANTSSPELAQIYGMTAAAIVQSTFMQPVYLRNDQNPPGAGSQGWGSFHSAIRDSLAAWYPVGGTSSLTCKACDNTNVPPFPASSEFIVDATQQAGLAAANHGGPYGTNTSTGQVTFGSTGIAGTYNPVSGLSGAITGYQGNPNFANGCPFLPYDLNGKLVSCGGSRGATQP